MVSSDFGELFIVICIAGSSGLRSGFWPLVHAAYIHLHIVSKRCLVIVIHSKRSSTEVTFTSAEVQGILLSKRVSN